MGKPTGFLEYERVEAKAVSPKERIKNFNEFHTPLSEAEQRCQSARCMDCGVPFCQSGMNIKGMTSGCPLNNLIPEWNDLVYTGNWEQAYNRLHKTSNFPEFTSRVCPALCEKACTCGLNGDPVCTKENEMAIIEHAYANGLAGPKPPKARTGKRIAVIGSGPSGLAVADQLNQRGHLVTVYERADRVGGLLRYGIPNMKLEKHIIDRKIDVMKEEGIEFITEANIGQNIKAKKIMEDYDAVVIGGGDTGNDCVGTCIRHGCKSVTQLEMMPKAPDVRRDTNPWPQWPLVCKTDYGQEEAIAVFGHDPRIYTTTVKEFKKDKKGNLEKVVTVQLESRVDEKTGRRMMVPVEGTEKELPCELVLIAAGFLGTQKYLTDAFGVEVNERTNIKTDVDKFATNVAGVFAAGDCHTGQSLVVKAIRQGRDCAREVDKYLMGYTNL